MAAAVIMQPNPVAAVIPENNPLTAAETSGTLAAVIMPERPPPRISITPFTAINRSVSLFAPGPVEDLLAEINIAPELRRGRFMPLPDQPFFTVLATA